MKGKNWVKLGLIIVITSIVYLNFTSSNFLNISCAQVSYDSITTNPTPGCNCNSDGSCSGYCNSGSGENRQCRPLCKGGGCWCPDLNNPSDIKDIGSNCKDTTNTCPTATPNPTATPKQCYCSCRKPDATPPVAYSDLKDVQGGTCKTSYDCAHYKNNKVEGVCVTVCQTQGDVYTQATWGTCGPFIAY